MELQHTWMEKLPNISFEGLTEPRMMEAFLNVYRHFNVLHQHRIIVRQRNLSTSSMQAQPLVSRQMDKSSRTYVINVAKISTIDQSSPLADLPITVLEGWFAHELGHICDYQNRSIAGLLLFLARYLTSTAYRREAERRADHFAVKHGFGKEIITTKRYILEHKDVSDRYKSHIKKYYLHPSEVENLMLDELNELPHL